MLIQLQMLPDEGLRTDNVVNEPSESNLLQMFFWWFLKQKYKNTLHLHIKCAVHSLYAVRKAKLQAKKCHLLCF